MTSELRARRMLTINEVLAIVPFSRTTLFRMESKGTFPASYWPSPGRRVWFEDEVIAWQNALPPNHRINSRQGVSGRSKNIKAVE
jgi:predicted DNA-binding transcriptional regulator AlpA